MAGVPPLVDAAWVRDRLGDDDVRLVDCRFTLGRPGAGRERYREGHLPGATFLDLDADLAGPPGPGGRHPLPDPDRFTAAVRRAGIGAGTHVVAYDDAMTGGAARLWWLLRHWGHERVSVLEGGLEGWDGPLARGEEPVPAPGDFVARPVTGDTVTADDVAGDLPHGRLLLLDARTPERYRGEREPVDPVAGRIPGAVNLPSAMAFPPPPALLAEERGLVAYCGSGVTACVLVLAFAAAGRDDVRLYPGSWSEWSGRGLPVANGAGPP